MNAVIVIPTIDPKAKIVSLVLQMNALGFEHVIVVNDGSGDSYDDLFAELELIGAHVIHHAVNLGKGAALKTGLSAARALCPTLTHVITMDGDGQHLPEDALRVYQAALESDGQVAIGTRNFHETGVPARSRIGNAFSAAYFKLDTGVSCPDTQTGLRAIPASLIPLALSVPGARYDYEMNFLTSIVRRGVPLAMVPITTVYEDKNAGSHFSPIRDSALIYRQLLKFTGSSVACAAVDLGLFALIVSLLGLETAALIAVATAIARICSGVLNFSLNRGWSFSDSGSKTGNVKSQAVRYVTLFLAQMLASMGLVTLFSFAPIPLVIVKALVDGTLFVVSYFIQRNWVFRGQKQSTAIIAKGGAGHAENPRSRIDRAF